MIALRRLVFGGRQAESGLRIRVINPSKQSAEQPESKVVTERPTTGKTTLDRFYASRYDAETTWYELGGR